MKRALIVITCIFLVGSMIWMVFHGRWESAYVLRAAYDNHSYLMDLDSKPLWSQPGSPSFADFTEHFSEGAEPLPKGGKIIVYHKWDWWLLDLIILWLIGSLVITPIILFFFRRDGALGAFARVGASLLIPSL